VLIPKSAQVPQTDRSELLALAKRAAVGEMSPDEGPRLATRLRHLVRLADELREPSVVRAFANVTDRAATPNRPLRAPWDRETK
jgi:hypothetical protein